MNKSLKFILLAALGACISSKVEALPDSGNGKTLDFGELAAFPGAEGYGRMTTGGRGGEVYIVTSLADDGSVGTLRYGIEKLSGPRTIVFQVSGTIHLTSDLRIKNGDMTIAGQTAPGDGICLAGFPVYNSASNVIFRFLRFRMGNKESIHPDGADAFGGKGATNVMIDHCSISWCTDECASFYGNDLFTMQWCIISESLRLGGHTKGPHGYGGIWGGEHSSFHHNLLAHHDSRNPRFGAGAKVRKNGICDGDYVDFRNNVIYNWGLNSTYGGERMNINLVNNYYKPGPATVKNSTMRGRIYAIDATEDGKGGYLWGKYYINGNVVDGGPDDKVSQQSTKDNWTFGVYNQFSKEYKEAMTLQTKDTIRMNKPHEFAPVTTHTALNAYSRVLDFGGCSLNRDELDSRIVNETRTRTAKYHGLNIHNGEGGIWKSLKYPKPGIIDSQNDLLSKEATANASAWPELLQGKILLDSDKDGMPDEWESKYGLDPNDSSDRNGTNIDKHGKYTNLEMYMNSLVHHIITKQNK